MSKIAEIFCNLVEATTYKGKVGKLVPLTNMTFFLGAGFAKSWDTAYPGGTELFHFDSVLFRKGFEGLGRFIEHCGFSQSELIDFDIFSECYYKLGMLKKYPEIRPRYIDEQTLSIVDAEFKAMVWGALNDRVKINWLNGGTLCHENKNNNQEEILRFFCSLFEQSDGSRGFPEGMRVNFVTTNYDFLIEGILDEYFQMFEDFHYLYTYRGFTPVLVNGERNIQPVHIHSLVFNVLKINGGLEIRREGSVFNIDHRKKKFDEVVQNPPELILPSKEQDYTSIYFKSIFSKVTRVLQESSILVIVGYSFPKEDVLLRFILRHFAEDDRDMVNKRIFYIDIGDEVDLRCKVRTICPSDFKLNGNVSIYSEGFLPFVKGVNKIGLP